MTTTSTETSAVVSSTVAAVAPVETTAVVTKVRGKAKDLMAARKHVTFGASFINGVLGGFHRDVAKMVLLGKELNVGTLAELNALPVDDLRTRVGDAILATEEGKLPASASY
jgi:hypothetical protein